MSTMSQAKMKAVASPNDSGEDDDDVGTLIYRESQLRKAEAAAAAAECKKTSNASTHHRTSTRKICRSEGEESLPRPQQCSGATKRKSETSLKDDRPRKKAAKKKYRYECSTVGCTNQVQRGGVCIKHGASVKKCSSEGCTHHIVKGGVCVEHGASVKLCSSEGCTNHAKRRGLCKRHEVYRNTQDQSTAFGSEFEMTTATQTLPNQRAFRATVREGQEGSRVPEEVAILCQEIVEV